MIKQRLLSVAMPSVGFIGILFSLLYLNASSVSALPLPKTLIEEIRLSSDTKIINFHDIQDKAPKDTRHLVVEVFTATQGSRAEVIPVQMVFNFDESGSYINRSLFGEADRLVTNLNEGASFAGIIQLPVRQDPKFGTSRAFIPWAFLENQSKHVLSESGVGGDFVASNMSHWNSLDSIDAISLKLDGDYKFAEGSLIQLYAVDETHRVSEQVLDNEQGIVSFPNLPQDKENLLVVGQTRASQVNPVRRGDRIWYSINSNDDKGMYQAQRLTGEAPRYNVLNLNSNKLLLDQMPEPRVGWNTAAEAPEGVFGPWLVHFPEYTNNNFYRSFTSLHGTHDSHYDPVGNEFGVWRDLSNIERLSFFPLASSNFKQDSRVSIYNSKKSDIRYVVEGGETEVKIDLPDSFEGIEMQVSARSSSGDIEDDLVIELNDQADSSKYLSQTIWARNNDGGAVREDNNLLGVIPADDMKDKHFSNIYGTIKGLNEGYQSVVHAYGGVSGDGRVNFTAINSEESDEVSSITFKTKSGELFASGSVFSIWFDDPHSDRGSEVDFSDSLNTRGLLVIAVLLLVVISLGVYRLKNR